VTIWGKRAEGLAELLEKGSRVLIDGRLRTRSYEVDGGKRYSTEIHADTVELCGSRENRVAKNPNPPRGTTQRRPIKQDEDPFEGYR